MDVYGIQRRLRFHLYHLHPFKVTWMVEVLVLLELGVDPALMKCVFTKEDCWRYKKSGRESLDKIRELHLHRLQPTASRYSALLPPLKHWRCFQVYLSVKLSTEDGPVTLPFLLAIHQTNLTSRSDEQDTLLQTSPVRIFPWYINTRGSRTKTCCFLMIAPGVITVVRSKQDV